MCGIYGYVGDQQAVDFLIDGIRRLEYRGYDSAGVAIIGPNGSINVVKRGKHKSSIKLLSKILTNSENPGTLGIGHTRWATHGTISEVNAHPHTDPEKRVAIVHNGIVENYLEIRSDLRSKGFNFVSETDSELIACLIADEIKKGESLLDSVMNLKNCIRGNSSVIAVSVNNPKEIIGIRMGNAGGIVIGLENNAGYVSSDVSALLPNTNKITYLENGELVRLSSSSYSIYDFSGKKINRELQKVEIDDYDTGKGNFSHYMIKEIYEQPHAIQASLSGRINFHSRVVDFDEITKSAINIKNFNRIVLTGMGTSLNAAIYGAQIFEKILGVQSSAENSSELRYRDPVFDEKTLLIAITQSGETADTLSAIGHFKKKSCSVISVIETLGTQASRVSDCTISIRAGKEVGVAATKTLTSTMSTLFQLALYFASAGNKLSSEFLHNALNDIALLPSAISKILDCEGHIKKLAENISHSSNLLYLGRGINIATALEGALKMKEVAYIHAEGYAAGEMKHGVNALLGPDMPTVMIVPDDHLYEKNLGTINEVKARGGRTLIITDSESHQIKGLADDLIVVPRISNELSPIIFMIPLQLLAYHTACQLGLDPDRPRNLAKTVTVE